MDTKTRPKKQTLSVMKKEEKPKGFMNTKKTNPKRLHSL